MNTISDVAQGKVTSGISTFEGTGELAAALDDFDEQIIINPLTYEEHKYRPSLEERLESIISGAALMADSSCTRDERRERYFFTCYELLGQVEKAKTQVQISEFSINTTPCF